MREEFEAFCRKHNLICEGERNKKLGYSYAETEIAWKAYQAGALAMRERAAKVCVDVPCHYDQERIATLVRALPVEE